MGSFLKKNLIAGLLVVIPVGLTYILLAFVIRQLDALMAPLVREAILRSGAPLPEDFHLPGLGFILTCVFMFVVGALTANFIGKKVMNLGESILNRIPIVRGIYFTFKKVIDSVSEVEEKAFDQMVLVRYPHLSTYVMGLISCNSKGEVVDRTEKGQVNVFVPMLPNVTLGWFLVVPENQVTRLKISREAGIKMLLSFGIVPAEQTSPKENPT